MFYAAAIRWMKFAGWRIVKEAKQQKRGLISQFAIKSPPQVKENQFNLQIVSVGVVVNDIIQVKCGTTSKKRLLKKIYFKGS